MKVTRCIKLVAIAVALFFIIFAPFAARAANEVIAEAHVTNGVLKFTTIACANKKGTTVAMFVPTGGGAVIVGCWTVFDDQALIEWQDGSVSAYPAASIKLRDGAKRKQYNY